MLAVNNIEVVYNNVILVLKGISLEVQDSQIVALLGANGAGKSTTLKAISGLLKPELGEVTRGSIVYNGKSIENGDPRRSVLMGIIQIVEGREVFEHLTAEDNLIIGGSIQKDRTQARSDLERVYDYFPILRDLKKRVSGYLSGGEQQMLLIGRALMAQPTLLFLDEPSLGLAPVMVKKIFEVIREINAGGVTILLVEQNARMAFNVAHYALVLENGRFVLEGTPENLMEDDDVKEFYLGIKSEVSVKGYQRYKRKKKWR